MWSGPLNERFNLLHGPDATASAKSGTVQCGGRAGKTKLVRKRPVLKQRVEKARMEDVSCAGSVHDRDAKGGYVVKLPAIPSQNTILAQRSSSKPMAKAAVHELKRFGERGCSREALGKIAADDRVVGESKQVVESGVKFVKIGDDSDPGRARPLCCLNGGEGIVTIEMKESRVGDPFAAQLRGIEVLTEIAVPEDGALTVFVEEDNALPTVAVGNGDAVSLDTQTGKFRTMQRSSSVIAELANVARGQRPGGAGGNRGGNLTAGQSGEASELQLGAGDGKVRERDHGVSCVETEADQVDGRQRWKLI